MILATSLGGIAVLSVVFITFGSRTKALKIDDYVAYRGKSNVLTMGFSLAASVLGGWILFSPGETGSWAGVAGILGYAFGQAMPLFLLAIFGPRLVSLLPHGFGLGDYVHSRYGRKTSLFVSIVMLFYMGTFLTAEMAAIGQVMNFALGIPMLVSCFAVILLIFAYVFRGGLGASIRTDRIQMFVLVPLLIALFVGVLSVLSRQGSVSRQINDAAPELLALDFLPGWKFAAVLFIGVTASNLFHQGFWQRIYSVDGSRSQRKAFLIGGFLIIPLVVIAGYFGIFAQGAGTLDPDAPSLALFSLTELLSPVFTVVLVLLAFVLVLSSVDTLVNGIVSVLTTWKGLDGENPSALRNAKFLTVGIGLLAALLGSMGGSVLYLFLLADLLCSAFVFPLIYGLYNKRISGTLSMIAGTCGLLVGALFFPLPSFQSWSGLPADMFLSFLIAFGLSGGLTVLFGRLP